MRVTTANSMSRSIELLQTRAQAMADAQNQLISGKRIARPSDDPSGAARVERALAREARADASQRALEASRNAMTLAEGAMGDANDLIQEARELVVQAGNAGYTDAQRRDLANAIRGIRNQLLQVANRGDGSGGYLFGAQGSSAPPFIDAAGGVSYRGTQGESLAPSDEPLPLTADGGTVFLGASSGNGVFVTEPRANNGGGAWITAGQVTDPSAITGSEYELVFSTAGGSTTYSILRDGNPTAVSDVDFRAGKAIEIDGMSVAVHGAPGEGDRFDLLPSSRDLSVFDALDRLADDLGTAGRTGSQVTQTVQIGLRDLDSSFSAVVAERSRLGEVLNRTDGIESRIADAKLLAQTERSNAEDIDMVQAVSEFSQRQTSYDAALKAYGMVQKLTLFEYIR